MTAVALTVALLTLLASCPLSVSQVSLESQRRQIDVSPGESVVINLQVTNLANRPASYLVNITSPSPYILGKVVGLDGELYVPSNATVPLTYIVIVDRNATQAPTYVTVFIISNDGSTSDYQTIQLDVAYPPDEQDVEDSSNTMVWILAMLVAAEVFAVFLFIHHRRKRYKDTRVEDIFVIHSDGRLIKHLTTNPGYSPDHYAVSGMLTAIKDFISDTFSQTSAQGGLEELQYGKHRILVEHGSFFYLAVVVSGDDPPELRREIRNAVSAIQDNYGTKLEEWDGAFRELKGIRTVLRPLVTFRPKPMIPGWTSNDKDRMKRLEERLDESMVQERVGELYSSGRFPADSRSLVEDLIRSLDDYQYHLLRELVFSLNPDEVNELDPSTQSKLRVIKVDVPGLERSDF